MERHLFARTSLVFYALAHFYHHAFSIWRNKSVKMSTMITGFERWFYINRAAPSLNSLFLRVSFSFTLLFLIGFMKFRQRYATYIFISQCSDLGWTISAPFTYCRNCVSFYYSLIVEIDWNFLILLSRHQHWLRFLLFSWCTRIL